MRDDFDNIRDMRWDKGTILVTRVTKTWRFDILAGLRYNTHRIEYHSATPSGALQERGNTGPFVLHGTMAPFCILEVTE